MRPMYLEQAVEEPDIQPNQVRVEVDDQIFFFKSTEHIGLRKLSVPLDFMVSSRMGIMRSLELALIEINPES